MTKTIAIELAWVAMLIALWILWTV